MSEISDIEKSRIDSLAALSKEDFHKELVAAEAARRSGSPGAGELMLRLARSQGVHHAKKVSASIEGVAGLLDRRRLAYGITDGCFEQEATFDRILLFQVPRVVGDKFEDSVLFKAEFSEQREEEENPVGIIVSAGCAARDVLNSNGMDIGHLVTFVRLSPARIVADVIRGTPVHLLVLRCGDIIASNDLPFFRRHGRASDTKDSKGNHMIRMTDSETISPKMPWVSSDI